MSALAIQKILACGCTTSTERIYYFAKGQDFLTPKLAVLKFVVYSSCCSIKQKEYEMAIVKNAVSLGCGFAAAQIEPQEDDATATLFRILGASAASALLLRKTSSNALISLASAVYGGLHGYHRNNEDIVYGLLWALTSDVGAGVALGQQYQTQSKKTKQKQLP